MSSAEATAIKPLLGTKEGARPLPVTDLDKLLTAARALLRSGQVSFKLSTRISAELIGPVRRQAYTYLCRDLPIEQRFAPAPALQMETWDSWDEAVRACETADDQILVMPKNRRYYAPKSIDLPVECRPLDAEDAARFAVLSDVFGGVVSDKADLERRLSAALAENKGLKSQLEAFARLGERAEALIEKCYD